ncbi:hypothetical protein OROGR_030961 [Orobanche gracilis]
MSGGEKGRPFVYTPSWVIAVVCFVIVFISVIVERALHNLGRFFKRKNQDSLYEALEKLKEELMILGFISLLLTVFQGLISRLCIPDHLASIMLPCRLEPPVHHQTRGMNVRRLLAEEVLEQCSEGHVPFLSLEALHQLHIFIFVLAVVYVIFSASTMVLGGIKISQWTHWEASINNEKSRHHRVSLLLTVGAKLEHIITQLAKEAAESAGDAEATTVRPSDELFWFHKPVLVLYLIHFILFQNSFEIAFFLWIWHIWFQIVHHGGVEFHHSETCHRMGTMFKQTLFEESTKDLILTWASHTKHASSGTGGSTNRLTAESTNSTYLAQQPAVNMGITPSEIELSCPNSSGRPSSSNN